MIIGSWKTRGEDKGGSLKAFLIRVELAFRC